MKKYVSTRILADFMILSNLIGKFLPYQDGLKGNALGPAAADLLPNLQKSKF